MDSVETDNSLQSDEPHLPIAAPNQSTFYSPLKTKKSFRLLRRAQTTTTQRSELPSFNLEEHDFKGCPEYWAVSYTWGPPFENLDADSEHKIEKFFTSSILIDGKEFLVTLNMFSVLEWAQQHYEYIWLDGCRICQSWKDERASQIPLMASIYSSASTVLIWLGGPHPDQDSFLWMANIFAKAISELIEAQGEESVLSFTVEEAAHQAGLGDEDVLLHVDAAHRFYMSCQWFRRCWIVQETVLAQSLLAVCNGREISWQGLNLLGHLFGAKDWSRFGVYQGGADPSHVVTREFCDDVRLLAEWRGIYLAENRNGWYEREALQPAFSVRNMTIAESGFMWLFDFVNRLRASQCSDARDKVYAAFGMSSKYFETPIEVFLSPQYELPPEQTYLDLTELVMKNLKSFNTLVFVEDRIHDEPSRTVLPSWVPNYDARKNAFPLAAITGSAFNAMGDVRLPWVEPNITMSRLTLTGACFGTIAQVVWVWKPDEIVSKNDQTAFLQLCENMTIYPNGESRVDALWRTLIINTPIAGRPPAPAHYAQYFKTYVADLLGLVVLNYYRVDQTAPISNCFIKAFKPLVDPFRAEIRNGQLPNFEEVVALMGAVWSQSEEVKPPHLIKHEKEVQIMSDALSSSMSTLRRPFRTAENFLGMGPHSTKIGDQVWLIAHCSTPLVLRPVQGQESTYTLVGECYLHGCMDGEMLDPKWNMLEKFAPITLV